MVTFLHTLTFPFINFNLNNSPSVFPPLPNSHQRCREAVHIYRISLSEPEMLISLAPLKNNLNAWMPRFSTSLKRCYLLSGPTWAAYFLLSVVWSLAAPQHKSATHYSVFLSLTIILATPSISAYLSLSEPPRSQKIPSPGAHFSNWEYPSSHTAGLFG